MDYSDSQNVICKVIVEGFPSRVELYDILDAFLKENDYSKDYVTNNKETSILFVFKNPDIGFGFAKHLNMIKAKRSLYSKLKTNLVIETKRPGLDLSEFYNSPKLSKSKSKSKKFDIHPNSKSEIRATRRKKEGNYVEEINYTKANPKGISLIASAPYIDRQKMEYLEYAMNKGKWLYKNGFDVHIHKFETDKKGEIPNYVTVSPQKYLVHQHKFRDVQKDHWVSHNDFLYKNSNDMIY